MNEARDATDLALIRARIIACRRCPRLREFCERIAREKRAAYRDEVYWGKPVPGFGDPRARIALVGLAPAAHGANRTGRIFTGDGVGGSGDFLMTALHAVGLANHTFSHRADDGLVLTDVWMAATARCAPPGNKPTLDEIANCQSHLIDELAALPRLRVVVALGGIAFDACLRVVAHRGVRPARRPAFAHGAIVALEGVPAIVASYHPSRQNTHTGRLTQTMLRRVLRRAVRRAIDGN